MKRSQKKRANLRVSFVIQDGPIAETILNIADAMYANFMAMSPRVDREYCAGYCAVWPTEL